MPDSDPSQNPDYPDQRVSGEQAARNGESLDDVVRIDEFESLFDGVHAYNKEFSPGAMMARVIFQHFRIADEPEESEHPDQGDQPEEGQRSFVEQETAQREMHAGILGGTSQATLEKLGLSLEPVSGKIATMSSTEGTIGAGEVRMNLTDGSKLLAFMGAVTTQDLEDDKLKANLSELASILTSQLADQYDLDHPSDAALELLGSLGELEQQYQRLGMSESPAVQRLSGYVANTRQGTLREWRAIEQQGLLQEPGHGFGPADWQKDASPQQLSEKWVKAIDLLNVLRQNDKANALYLKMKQHLTECVGIAEADLPSIEYYEDASKQELGEVLAAAKLGLEALGSESQG